MPLGIPTHMNAEKHITPIVHIYCDMLECYNPHSMPTQTQLKAKLREIIRSDW
jgi:hypothetical protein